ncbi:MAG: dienelactone hydrolase family protein [Anaerospora sp.]|jgi:dienelactone hydrolase|nr:dienelactone hydrolase family protein [Anaerospora sp.]
MLQIQNNSNTVILVLHEIYGINNHISGICNTLADGKNDVLCPNMLLPNQTFSPGEEAAAYNNFMQNIGFSAAQQQVEKLSVEIQKNYKYRFIIGFSIGATLAWLCSQREGLYSGVVGFYGSRIRDYKNVVPKCPVLLFFPRREESFDVNHLIHELSDKDNTSIVQVDALHGFANPLSGTYCPEASDAAITQAIAFFNRQKQ